MEKDTPKKEDVWVKVICAFVQSSNSTHKDVAIKWADFIAEEYSKRFL